MIKIIIFFGGIFFAQAQINTYPREKKFVVEAALSKENSSAITKDNISGALGLWYRYPIEEDARLELGGSVKSGSAIYNFDYGKEGNIYKINSTAVFLNLGGRMIKEFTIKSQKIEWISELTFATLFFDGKDIPDSPPRETEEGNTIQLRSMRNPFLLFSLVRVFGSGTKILDLA